MSYETLHGAITMRVIGDFAEACAELRGVEGLVELYFDSTMIVIRFVPYTPAEDAARRWLRGGEDAEQAEGTPWRRVQNKSTTKKTTLGKSGKRRGFSSTT